MNAKQQSIIDDFLKTNPQFHRAEWTSKDGLDVYFADNPDEPMIKEEFIPGSVTRILLNGIDDPLTEAENDEDLR